MHGGARRSRGGAGRGWHVSRRHRAAARKAMPFRAWIVGYEAPYYDEERETRLISARCPSQAVRVWRERLGLVPADVDISDLSVEPAVWGWPEVAEPTCPRKPCEWVLTGRTTDGVELIRGYGFHFLDDVSCDNCAEMTSDERITYANFAEASDVPLCPDCLAECREKGEVVP